MDTNNCKSIVIIDDNNKVCGNQTNKKNDKDLENNNNNINNSNYINSLEANKKFEKSTSSIQIDNIVDFTIIKGDGVKNKNKKDKDSNSKSSSISSKRKRNKNKIINDDLEILNVDDTEQSEENILKAQKPLGYEGDYYTMNQELPNTEKNDQSPEKKTEEEEDYDENEEDPNEPKIITNSFFTESTNIK